MFRTRAPRPMHFVAVRAMNERTRYRKQQRTVGPSPGSPGKPIGASLRTSSRELRWFVA